MDSKLKEQIDVIYNPVDLQEAKESNTHLTEEEFNVILNKKKGFIASVEDNEVYMIQIYGTNIQIFAYYEDIEEITK